MPRMLNVGTGSASEPRVVSDNGGRARCFGDGHPDEEDNDIGLSGAVDVRMRDH